MHFTFYNICPEKVLMVLLIHQQSSISVKLHKESSKFAIQKTQESYQAFNLTTELDKSQKLTTCEN